MILRSQRLLDAGFPCHGFTTREGGVSEGDFSSWNFSTSPGDREDHVELNFQRLAAQIGVDRGLLRSVKQIHSDRVVLLERVRDTSHEEADAILSLHPDLVIGVKTADCVPILLADPDSRAVAAIHAGWRGVVSGILPHTIRLLREHRPATSLLLAIGPHIRHFQVGEEVAARFPDHSRPDPSESTRFLVDLQTALLDQAACEGIPRSSVDTLDLCTLDDPQKRFFSHRASRGRCGRMFNFISPRLPPS